MNNNAIDNNAIDNNAIDNNNMGSNEMTLNEMTLNELTLNDNETTYTINNNLNINIASYFLYNMNYTNPYIATITNDAIIPNPIMNDAIINEYTEINPHIFNNIYDIVITDIQYNNIIQFLNSFY